MVYIIIIYMNKKIIPKYKIVIKKHMSNQRIDNFLFKKFKNLPKSMIYRCLRIGKIRLSIGKINPNYKLQINDNILLFAINIPLIKNKKINLKKSKIDFFLKTILYEDKYLIIINKPYGIAVHGGSGINYGIIEIFRSIRPDILNLELVHRLDKDTSGVLMLSKKSLILKDMHRKLRERKIYKEYLAITHGHWSKNKISVKFPLLKNKKLNKKNSVYVHPNGKPSQTNFVVKKKYINTTLVSIIPITGRTHQIRIHAAQSGHPIIFDQKYGIKKIKNCKFIKKNKIRLLLHAKKIVFKHPKLKKIINISATLDEKFTKYINFFSKNIHKI